MCNFIKYLIFKFKITRIFGSYYLEKRKNDRSQQKKELQFIKIDIINWCLPYLWSLANTFPQVCGLTLFHHQLSYHVFCVWTKKKYLSSQKKTIRLKSSQQSSTFVDLTINVATIEPVCQNMVFTLY